MGGETEAGGTATSSRGCPVLTVPVKPRLRNSKDRTSKHRSQQVSLSCTNTCWEETPKPRNEGGLKQPLAMGSLTTVLRYLSLVLSQSIFAFFSVFISLVELSRWEGPSLAWSTSLLLAQAESIHIETPRR